MGKISSEGIAILEYTTHGNEVVQTQYGPLTELETKVALFEVTIYPQGTLVIKMSNIGVSFSSLFGPTYV